MGDAIMSLPFLRAAREKYDVFVCGQPSVREVFQTCIPNEQIISWRPPWLDEDRKYGFSKWKNAGLANVVSRLRGVRAQTAISVWADTRVHIMMALSGARERIGFPMNKRNVYASQLRWRKRQIVVGRLLNLAGDVCLGRRLLTQKLHKEKFLQHHVECWRQLAEVLDLDWNVAFPWLQPPPVEMPEDVARWLQDSRSSGRKIWLVHPGARAPNRRWPINNFRKLIEQCLPPDRVSTVLIDPVESPLPKDFLPGVFVFRPSNFAQFLGILKASGCVICNDTGVAHAAAALGKPVISIFSANRPEWFAPYGSEKFAAHADVCPHRPCLDRCVMPSFTCIEAVTIEMVSQQISKALDL